MTGPEVKTWLEIVEIGLKSLAIIGAVFWAVLLHRLLRKTENAQADLRAKGAQIRAIDLNCKQQAVVKVDIRPTVHPAPEGHGHLILTTVELKNRGTRNTRIKWGGQVPAFNVRKVTFHENGKPRFDKSALKLRISGTSKPDQEPISHVIRAGSTESIPFAVRVPTPGLYLLSFRGRVDEEERRVSESTGATLPVRWTGKVFVLVPREQPEPAA